MSLSPKFREDLNLYDTWNKNYEWRVRKGGNGNKLLFGSRDFDVSLFLVVTSKSYKITVYDVTCYEGIRKLRKRRDGNDKNI